MAAKGRGQAEGQFVLGSLYFFRKGVPASYHAPMPWSKLAQDNGQAEAQMCRDAALPVSRRRRGSARRLPHAQQAAQRFGHVRLTQSGLSGPPPLRQFDRLFVGRGGDDAVHLVATLVDGVLHAGGSNLPNTVADGIFRMDGAGQQVRDTSDAKVDTAMAKPVGGVCLHSTCLGESCIHFFVVAGLVPATPMTRTATAL